MSAYSYTNFGKTRFHFKFIICFYYQDVKKKPRKPSTKWTVYNAKVSQCMSTMQLTEKVE